LLSCAPLESGINGRRQLPSLDWLCHMTNDGRASSDLPVCFREAGHDDDGKAWMRVGNLLNQPVPVVQRHPNVTDHRTDDLATEDVNRLERIGRRPHRVAQRGKPCHEQSLNRWVIIDDQDPSRFHLRRRDSFDSHFRGVNA